MIYSIIFWRVFSKTLEYAFLFECDLRRMPIIANNMKWPYCHWLPGSDRFVLALRVLILADPVDFELELQIGPVQEATIIVFGLGVQQNVQGAFEHHEHVGPVKVELWKDPFHFLGSIVRVHADVVDNLELLDL